MVRASWIFCGNSKGRFDLKKIIVITTIHEPTEAIMKYIGMSDWQVIVVGDLKTPHVLYERLQREGKIQYLSPEWQSTHYSDLSDAIGWNTSCRRSIGFIVAYKQGCDLLAHVDDDNIPYDNWGKDIIVNKETEVVMYKTENLIFEPLAATNVNFWHRGFPLDLVKDRHAIRCSGTAIVKVLVQANLWNGNPDIDALQRILFRDWEDVKFNVAGYFTSNAPFSPFDSQNTIMAREVIPYFMLIPNIGRVDDIWGSYLAQHHLYSGSPIVAYGPATVYQDRHPHDLFDDFEKEVYSYKRGSAFVKKPFDVLPQSSINCFNLYRSHFNE